MTEKKVLPVLEKTIAFKDADNVRAAGLYPYFRPIQSDQDTEVLLGGKKVLMFGSNSYLGLTCHPKVKESAINAIKKYGTGCGGSPFLNGTLDIHLECEEKLAKFMGKEAVLLFSTGMQANLGAISAMTNRDEYLILDKFDHASIIDGSRLGIGRVNRFQHNDMGNLEHVLSKCTPGKGKLIVVDGVFSMHGDLAKLPEIIALADKYDAAIMVDEAHGLGVLGKRGAGTCEHFNVTERVDIIMGTFSKSLATVGGFIASNRKTIDYLKHHSRALIFSASIAPANVGAVIAALDILEAEPELLTALWNNTRRMSANLTGMGFRLGDTETPILPVLICDDMACFTMCRRLQEEGVFVNPVVSPAVEPGHALIRVSLMATHTFEQIDRACEKFKLIGKELGILT